MVYVHYFTESQNHRILRVGKDLCGSSSPAPLLKQGNLEQALYKDLYMGMKLACQILMKAISQRDK